MSTGRTTCQQHKVRVDEMGHCVPCEVAARRRRDLPLSHVTKIARAAPVEPIELEFYDWAEEWPS